MFRHQSELRVQDLDGNTLTTRAAGGVDRAEPSLTKWFFQMPLASDDAIGCTPSVELGALLVALGRLTHARESTL
jgi:hypothetical protein